MKCNFSSKHFQREFGALRGSTVITSFLFFHFCGAGGQGAPPLAIRPPPSPPFGPFAVPIRGRLISINSFRSLLFRILFGFGGLGGGAVTRIPILRRPPPLPKFKEVAILVHPNLGRQLATSTNPFWRGM